MQTFFSLILYSVQIILPFMAVMISYYCFKSLFGGLNSIRPLIVLVNKSNREKIPILYWENSIGRDRHCDIVVDSPNASRDHAVLYRRDEGWMIADTNSKCGTFINGKKIKNDQKVYIDDIIDIGGVKYQVSKADILQPDNIKSPLLNDTPSKKIYSQAGILFIISIFQLLSTIEICFAKNEFNYEPIKIFGMIFAVSWLCFLATKYIFKRTNFEIESLGIFLSGIGITNVCSLSPQQAYIQLIAMGVGIILFEILVFIIKNPDFAMKLRTFIALLACLLLVANLAFGKVKNGSQNWIMIGNYSFQPSEFVKVAFVFFGASTLKGIQTTKNLTWFIVFSGICMGALFMMGDFGTASIFFVTFILISFMRSGSVRTVVLTCAAAALGFLFILKFKPYIVTRFSAWRHVWQYVNSIGYQQTRVLTYSASGGLLGMGIGKGYLKYIFAAPSDLAFGMLCEEWGVITAFTILASLILLVIYAKNAGVRCRSAFYTIASCCASGMMAFQMIMNVFGVVDVFPLTGVTLPFISLGGSSLISVWGLLAFVKASDERTYAVKLQ